MLGGGFRKAGRRRNIRKKVETHDSDEEKSDSEKEEKNKDSETTAIPKAKLKPTKTALSFGDELQEGDEIVLKKSKASLSMKEQTKRERKLKKKKEKEKGKFGIQDDNSNSSPALQINNSVIIKTFAEDEVADDFDVDSVETIHKFSLRRNFGGSDQAIPDAATIYAMKKQREQARQSGGQNYIPLGNKYEGRFSSKNSRLVREDMDGSSDDERMEMKGSVKEAHPAIKRRNEVAQALEDAQDDDRQGSDNNIDDEDFRQWENEQIKKGSKVPASQPASYGPKLPDSLPPPPMPPSIYKSMGVPMMQPTAYASKQQSAYGSPSLSYSIPVVDQEVITVDYLCKKLSENLETKKQMNRIHKQELEKTKFDLQSSNENIVHLNAKTEDISERFSFFQDIRGYVKDLLECLNEKVKLINDLESSLHQTLKKNTDKIVNRRQNDVKDESEEVSGKAISEPGRVANIKNRRIAERESRRTRRQEKRQYATHYDGMSSDDELIPSEELRFKAERDKVVREASATFQDVIEDFSSTKEIKNRFEQWKLAFNDSYKQAYLGLCLPKLFTPFIKLELLNWNPLEIGCTGNIEEMNWFVTLSMYGDYGNKSLSKEEEEDDDIMLIPNIVEKIVIPKLTVLMKDVWDPMSTNQTKLAVILIQQLITEYPSLTTESKETKALIDIIKSKLQNAVEIDVYIPIFQRALLESPNSKALKFLQRQFWKGFKLLQNVLCWNWILSRATLQQFGIDAILNRYLIIALQQFPDPISAFEKAKMIVSILPKEWLEKSDDAIPGLQSFTRLLISLATNTYKNSLGYNEIQKKKVRVTIKKIISLLMHIHAFDDARFVATNFKDEVTSVGSPTAN